MKPVRRIAIWIPNLARNSGGAEIYLLNLACILNEEYEVFLLTARCRNAEESVSHAFQKYEIPEFPVRYLEDPEITDRSQFVQQLLNRETVQHHSIEPVLNELDIDLFINGTYGNLCGFPGIQNWHIVHFPAKPIRDEQFEAHVLEYLNSYDHFFCNSEFTAGWFFRYYGRKAEVLYPPVDIDPISESETDTKENIILTCGRIVPAKKMLEMIRAFRALYEKGIHDYRFIIAGLTDPSQENYLKQLKEESRDLPVDIVTDLPRNILIEYYRKAKYYWHAMGLGTEEEDPLKMEHFGMSTVEAMAAGCVPIVIDRGGQKEIAVSGTGYRFSTADELVSATEALIRDPRKTKELACAAVRKAETFCRESYRKKISAAIDDRAY